MAFGWVIRHQKKALFVLAAVLVVSWVLSLAIGGGSGGGERRSDTIARVAGQDVTWEQFRAFRASWMTVFPEMFGPDTVKRIYSPRGIGAEEVAWGWYALLAMGRQAGIEVGDDLLLEWKRQVYRGWTRDENARFDDAAEAAVTKTFGVTGPEFDEIMRERIIAQTMLMRIREGLQGTQAEAWELYAKENRAVRVSSVSFPAASFRAQTPVPDNAQVQAWYDARKGIGGEYFSPSTVQIEYAQLTYAKLGAGVAVTSDEMQAFYKENRDSLYKLKDAKDGAEAEYITFPEVKPEIEERLKRKAANERADKIFDDLRKAFELAPPELTLTDVVKSMKEPALECLRSPFLTDVQLLDLPGIGSAHAGPNGLARLAFERGITPRRLSPELTSPEGRWVFRLMVPPREGSVPALPDVRDRVVDDIRKSEALKLAFKAAGEFDNDVRKRGGPAAFEKLAEERKLPVVETPFFLNNLFDAARPEFIDRSSDLATGAVYGPWVSERDGVAAVVKVLEERPAERAGFEGEMATKRSYALAEKRAALLSQVFPRGVLKTAGFLDLRPKQEPAEETLPNPETPPVDNQTAPDGKISDPIGTGP